MATVLAIDYGHKKIGFAVGQTITQTAKPLEVIKQNGEMWKKIDKIFNNWKPAVIVVGKPKLADGKKHPLESSILDFILLINRRYSGTVYREDETLTSQEVVSLGLIKNPKEQNLDAYSASILLESWMRDNMMK